MSDDAWHQLSNEEQRQHEEEITKEDWDDYHKWSYPEDQPWWRMIDLDVNFCKLLGKDDDRF